MTSLVRYFIFISTLLLIFSISYSQKKVFNGYYINKQGDTINGAFSNYKQWNYNPKKVSFLPINIPKEIELTPGNCSEFHIENYDTYISYRGKRLINPIELNAASAVENKDIYDTINVFLRLIAATDQYIFYMYKDQVRINIFYSKRDKVITELLQKASIINNSFWESNTYKQQLKELFADESKNAEIDNLIYSDESLAAFINKHYKERSFTKTKKNNSNGFYLIGGVSYNSFNYKGTRSSNISTQDYPSTTVPLGGLGYIISLNRNFDKLFLFPQLKLFSFNHSITTVYNNSYPAFTNTFRSSAVISAGFHLGYNIINTPNLKASISPGGGITMLVKNKQIDEVRHSPTDTKTTVTHLNKTTSLVDMQAIIIIKRKYLIWSSYNLPTSVTNSSSNELSAIQFGIGYKF